MIRRRRSVRNAREQWVNGRFGWLARWLAGPTMQGIITPRPARIISLIELAPGRRYLDIGCGTGAYAHLLAARAGLDEPPITMDLVAAPFPADLVAAPEHLPFSDSAFDCITCFYYIRRWDDDAVHALAQEIRRVLAPGGSALVLEVAPVHNGLLNRLHAWLLGFGCSSVDLRGWGRLAALFTESGFDAIDLVNTGPFLVPPIPRVGVLLRLAPESVNA